MFVFSRSGFLRQDYSALLKLEKRSWPTFTSVHLLPYNYKQHFFIILRLIKYQKRTNTEIPEASPFLKFNNLLFLDDSDQFWFSE